MIAQREKASSEKFAVRRIHPGSDCWRPPPEGRFTSAAFSDDLEETSVDLSKNLSLETCDSIKIKHQEFLAKGFGLAFAQVQKIEEMFRGKNIDGAVYHDPLPENPEHGVITGKHNKAKRKALSHVFEICTEPNAERYFKNLQETQT